MPTTHSHKIENMINNALKGKHSQKCPIALLTLGSGGSGKEYISRYFLSNCFNERSFV